MEESLETTAQRFIDNLLDFSSDIGEDVDDDDDNLKPHTQNQLPLLPLPPNKITKEPADLTLFDSDDAQHASFSALVEEELEWLSNENAFPPIESFDIPTVKPNNAGPKNQSPVSVLGNGNNSSIRIPVQARSKRRRRRRTTYSEYLEQQWWYCYEPPPKKKSVGPTRRMSSGKRCMHCQAEKTPQWRAGPYGPKTLCNACGVRYKSGRLVPEYRPASSPTFSDDLHSNSHRKIMDMRRQKQNEMYLQPSDQGW